MIDLYGCGSPNVAKILFMLSETDLPFRTIRIDTAKGEQFSDEFVALNPNSKVPVIVDHEGPGDEPYTVFESGAILLYLAEKSGKLLPTDPIFRHRVHQWLFFQTSYLGPMCGQERCFAQSAPKKLGQYALDRYVSEVRRLLDVLDKRLAESSYVAGDEFTLADIAVFPGIRLHTDILGGRHGRDFLVKWMDKIKSRPGFQK